MRRIHAWLGALVLVPAVAGVVVGAASPAAADPGYCGVRLTGPDVISGSIAVAYIVQNKCQRNWNFALYFPEFRRTSPCSEVLAGGHKTYVNVAVDPNWTIVTC